MHGFIPFHSFRDITRGLYQSWLFSTLSKSRVHHLDEFPRQDNVHMTSGKPGWGNPWRSLFYFSYMTL